MANEWEQQRIVIAAPILYVYNKISMNKGDDK